MTSKEALSDLYSLAIGDKNHTKKYKETIEKDLEILDILKDVFNYKTVQKFVDNMTKEDFFKVKEWLENEQINKILTKY